MDIWQADKLILFIAFVIPGLISLKTYGLFYSKGNISTAQQVLDSVAYSSINYALLFWPILKIEASAIKERCPGTYFAFYVFVLLIAPIMWAYIFSRVRTAKCFQNVMPHPVEKPWDYIFRQRIPYWIIVSLKNGDKIAGKYSTKSFASSSPAGEQLYLEETWVLNNDGGFERPRVESAGILVLASEVVSVELFNLT